MFWADVRSKSAYVYFGDVVAIDSTCLARKYVYFGDVVAIDSTCLARKYEVPLVAFIGTNHGQSIILGCGLPSGGTIDSYVWLFRAWLTFMLGGPQCFSLSRIMQRVPQKLGGLLDCEAIIVALSRAVYYSLRVEEFEADWEDTIQRYDLMDHEWLKMLHDDRKQWVPVYVKETFLAGMFPVHQSESVSSIFEGYLHENTPLREFFDKYDQILRMNHQGEAIADLVSRNESFRLISTHYFELQLSKMYTTRIFKKIQNEINGMHNCFSITKINVDGPVLSYIVKYHVEAVEENRRVIRDYEVLYNTSEMEVHCICGLFKLNGYLCRHALKVLDLNEVEELPSDYILSRWRKDIKRSYMLNNSRISIDVNNPVHRYDYLHKCVVNVVEEGRKTQDRYNIALRDLDEILNMVHLVEHWPSAHKV